MTETPDVSTSSIPDETPESSLITQSDEPSINVKAQREEEQRKAELDKQRRLQEEAARRQRKKRLAVARSIDKCRDYSAKMPQEAGETPKDPAHKAFPREMPRKEHPKAVEE